MDILDLVHEDRSASTRPFFCHDDLEDGSLCTKTFARRSDLVRHKRIHTQDRPFTCEWPSGCARTFIQRSALTVHMRVHTGERPHQCEYKGCEKAFSDSSSLARHRRIHTGKRPYLCNECRKTFCRKTTLTKHIKRNHNGLDGAAGMTVYDDTDLTQSASSSSPATPSDFTPESPSFVEVRVASPHDAGEDSYYPSPIHAEEPSSKSQIYSPLIESLQRRDSIREHLDNALDTERVYLTPPPLHPRHMLEVSPECPHIMSPHQAYALPDLSPTPSFAFPVTTSPHLHHLASACHFQHSHRYHIAPPPPHLSHHMYLSPYSNPLPAMAFVGADSFPPSPIVRTRRASSTSAIVPASLPTPGLGISLMGCGDAPRSRSSFNEYIHDFVSPPSPVRPQRSTSITFPSASSLPGIGSYVKGLGFSSFVTSHIERMEDDAMLMSFRV